MARHRPRAPSPSTPLGIATPTLQPRRIVFDEVTDMKKSRTNPTEESREDRSASRPYECSYLTAFFSLSSYRPFWGGLSLSVCQSERKAMSLSVYIYIFDMKNEAWPDWLDLYFILFYFFMVVTYHKSPHVLY